jgi:diguanylate cyclase (GGDEF)-like protein
MSSCFSFPNRSVTVFTLDLPTQPLSPLIQALKSRGYELILHPFLKVDIDQIQKAKPDLILINLRAIGSTGYELCQAIRQEPAIQDAPVIFVGSDLTEGQSLSALKSGANDYLTWPLQLEESVLRLEKHLHQSLLIRQLKSDNAMLCSLVQDHERVLQEQESHRVTLAQRNQELQRLAYIDGLTQVANRLGFNQQLSNLWKVLRTHHQPLALILCDVDYFKRYNDTYGHPAGDQCLRMVAKVLTQAARRSTDLVARYGGEEFAILLPATKSQSAAQIAQNIQANLLMRQWPHATSCISPFVSLSIGIASIIPTPSMSADILIQLADEALYEAKVQGRNRIVVANTCSLSSPDRPSYCASRALEHQDSQVSRLSLEAKCY